MRMALAVLLNSLLILSVPTPLLAKGKTVKITIKGADLKTPIEISDPKILANFQVWTSIGLKVRSENRPSRFAGIKSRSTQIQKIKSFTWSTTRSVPARSRVMYICPANPMNGPDSMCVRSSTE
jgi:hypothetical protein